jgi:hypothetical protein
MRKTILMMSAAFVTVFLAGAASAGPFNDSIKAGNKPSTSGTAGKVATGGVGKSTASSGMAGKIATGGVGKPSSPPPLGTPIPAPSSGPKIGPYDKVSNPGAIPPKLGTPIPSPSTGPKIGPYDKVSNPGVIPPKLGTPIPSPSTGPKIGPYTNCKGCTVTDVTPKPPTTVPMPPAPTTPPAPGGGMGGGMGGGGKGSGHHHHHGHYFPGVLAFGVGAAAAATEYVPVYQAAPAPAYTEAQQAYAPVEAAPQVAVPAAVNPFDEVIARLNQLNAALSQGLITQNDYRSQRPAILAALDAGQVSRSIGIQQGLRQLKSMADGGFINGAEYDAKRREFTLFI